MAGFAVNPSGLDVQVPGTSGGAPLASPHFTGTPTAPTAAPLTNSTQLATSAYADAAVAVAKPRGVPQPIAAQFANNNYSFGTGATVSGDTVLHPQYSLLIIQFDQASLIPAFKVKNPNVKVGCYIDIFGCVSTDNFGNTHLVPYRTQPSGLLLDSGGVTCQSPYNNALMVDPGSTFVLSGIVPGSNAIPTAGSPLDRLIGWCKKNQIDIVWVDNVNGFLGAGQTAPGKLASTLSTGGPITSLPLASALTSGGYKSGQTVLLTSGANNQTWTVTGDTFSGSSLPVSSQTPNFAYPTNTPVKFNITTYANDAAWQANGMLPALLAMKYAFNAAGIMVIPNVAYYNPSATAWFQACVDSSDGMFDEFFTDGGGGIANQSARFPTQILEPGYCEGQGKIFMGRSKNLTQTGNGFGLAYMLLSSNRRSVYNTNGSSYLNSEVGYPEQGVVVSPTTTVCPFGIGAQGLGYPTGAFTTTGQGLKSRTFINMDSPFGGNGTMSRVIVNDTNAQIIEPSLPDTGPGGASITLAAYTAVIGY